MEKQKFYITTAIAYASGKPHIGNTYEIILTDAIARYKKMRGYDVFFLTGTDEHGQKIENLAKDAGITPKEYVDNVAGKIKEIWDMVGADYDKFIRTTDDYHEEAVSAIFKKLYEKGDIYKSEYEGLYCVPCESFFTETQAAGGICPDCGRPVQKTTEEAYFFKMSKYTDKLMKYIEDNPDFISPEPRKKEMVNNFIKPGLQDLCVSRSSFKWGVPVSFDDKHVIYVWIDALSNYITALGYNPNNESQPELYNKYWPADVHIIGKDILRFHTIYWPIMLMALGEPLPKRVFGHPWLLFGADKMSKSKGNIIYADELVRHFGVDGVRYYVLSEMPFAADGSITYESVIERYNSSLANNLGNLVNRTLSMTAKYFDSVVPSGDVREALDDELCAAFESAKKNYCELMDDFKIADASEEVFNLLRRANKYIDETTPWILAKDEALKPRLGTVLYNLLEVIRAAAVMLYPIMPQTAKTIFEVLATNKCSFESIEAFGQLAVGSTIGASAHLFDRIDEAKKLEEINAEIEARNAAANAGNIEKPEGVAQIGIDDFMKVELRVAKVIACEGVPKAKKLLKLQLDLGYEKRQVVSGIAKFYAPEDLIGKKIIVVANLAPAKLCGVESEGMILASGEEEIKVVFLDESAKLGDRIR
ncbi:MAG: methionine--tRNA ligase [Ruminococcaceae bacterium]|nr:methionine--tRNA ligase [Oscillospiraceae bacterium]